MKNSYSLRFSLITLLILINYIGFGQVPESLYGVVDNFFVTVETTPTNIETPMELETLEGERTRTLAFVPSECRFYGIIKHVSEPTLVWFDSYGNSGVIGQLSYDGTPVPMCESIAYNPLDGQLYGGVSLDGNPGTNNDYQSETLVQVDYNTAECTFISETNGDMDALEFSNEHLITSDTENGNLIISHLLFENIPSEVTFNQLYYTNQSIYIVDLAATTENSGIIYCTTGHDLYSLDVLIDPPTLEWLGVTHTQNDYNGERMYGIATAPRLNSEFNMEIDDYTVEFIPEDAYHDVFSYYWDFGDSTSSEDYNPIHTYDGEGRNYDVCLTVTYQGCSSTNCENILVFPSSVYNFDSNQENQLIVAPNPARDHVLIELKDTSTLIRQIEVYDLGGKLAFKKSTIMSSNYLIDITNLSSGEYIIIVNGEYSQKFVKS